MSKPKLALIPSGYKSGKVYSILPNNGDGDFTFSRSSTATRVNKDGLIETVASNIPRLDYTDGGCPSLLLEPQRTNLFLNSDASSVPATGTKTNITFDTNDWLIGLNGNVIFEDNTVNRIYYNGTVLASTQYTLSFYIKTDDGLEPTFGVTSSDIGRVNIGNNSLSLTYELELFSEGIWRVKATGISDTVNLSSNGILKVTSNNNIGFKATGFQLEQGDYATSYIPTNGSTATRNRDLCNNAGDANTFNDSEGVLYAQIGVELDNGFVSLNDGTTGNRISIYFNRTNRTIRMICSSGGAGQVDTTYTSPTSISENVKVALKYKENDFALWVDGSEVRTDNSALTPIGLSRCDFAVNTILPFYGKCKDLRVYNTALTDAELQELTTI